VPNNGRLVTSVDTAGNTLTLGDHGLSEDDAFSLRPEGGVTASMAAPLVANTTYFAGVVSDSLFKAKATAGGSAIDLTTAGARMVLVVPLPISAVIRWASSMLDQFLPAHAVPLDGESIPEILRATCAELAAGKLLRVSGKSSKTITAMIEDAGKLVQRWGKGVPLRGENAPTTHTNLARSASLPYNDARGWNRFGGIR
jgi:hypothetical protein